MNRQSNFSLELFLEKLQLTPSKSYLVVLDLTFQLLQTAITKLTFGLKTPKMATSTG